MGQIQFLQDVGDDILRATGDGLVKFGYQLSGQNSLVLLAQAGLQTEIQLTSTHGLGEEIGYASFASGTFVRGEREKNLRESIDELNLVTQR